MELITRDIINKNILFKDVNAHNLYQKDKVYTFDDLDKQINIVKNILQNEYQCREGQTALIGITPCVLQIATFFACAELGLNVVIADHNRNDNWINPDYVDPKTQSLLPIDYFIVTSDEHLIPKYKLFYRICDKTVSIRDLDDKDATPNHFLGCTENSLLLKCTSSGTTGTAKLVNHSHGFLKRLIERNKVFYYGSVCMAHNLNHGSSPATYFLPALCAEDTKIFVSFMITYLTETSQTTKSLNFAIDKFNKFNFDHLMIPYSYMIDNFLKYGSYENLNLYTLSTIKQQWVPYFLDKKIKNIISIFGSNETSGPTFINEIADHAFKENKYREIDKFYDINLIDGNKLEVTMPYYGTKIITNDLFDRVGVDYYHKGRNDLYRVNGHEVNVAYYTEVIKKYLDADLIIDTVKDSLYIAVWQDDQTDSNINIVREEIKKSSYNVHNINKYAVLDKNKFMTGIKLDMELLRDYFRKFI
jgi:hypothetical protein